MPYTYRDARATGNGETVTFGTANPPLVAGGWVLVADDLDAAAVAAVAKYNRNVAESSVVTAAQAARAATEAASSGAGVAGGGATLDAGGDVPATQLDNMAAALALKANVASPTFTGTVGGITAPMVGLDNVTNEAQLAKTGGTLTGQLVGSASTTARATLRIPHGVAPTTPVDGDMWTTTAGLFIRVNGATVGPLT